MSPSSKSPRRHFVLWAGATLLVVALGTAVWLATRPAKESATAASPGASTATTATDRHRRAPASGRDSSRPAPPDAGQASAAVAAIVGDSSINDLTARNRLLALVNRPDSPLSERLEALEHVLLLTPDTDSTSLLPLASGARLPAEIRSRLIDDAHNRSGKPQLEILLALLETANTDQREEIRELLRFLLDEDHGEEAAAWRVAVEAKKFPSP